MNTYENTCIGDYTIAKTIAPAHSIDGHVLLGVDPHGAKRAIKIGNNGTEELIAGEARTLARLNHPAIATYCQTGEHHGAPYLVTAPYCPTTLEDRIKEKPLDAQQTRAIARTILHALEHAHARGVYHQDLAPRHILITEENTPLLSDFGNANTPGIESSVKSVKRLGSMPYMNVDQLMGKPPTPKTDIYATGMILAHAHNGHYWDLLSSPSKDTALSKFITKLVIPNGYQNTTEALTALRLEEEQDPARDALQHENGCLRTTALRLQTGIERNYGWSKKAALLAFGSGLLIRHALTPGLFDWLLR